MIFVFADESGGLDDKQNRFLILSTLIASNEQKKEIDSRCERLKNSVTDGLRKIITPKLFFAMVVIDKNQSGGKNIREIDKYINQLSEKLKPIISYERREQLEILIQKLPSQKGFGALGYLTSLLFGVTSGLIHEVGLIGPAKVVVDRQFVKQRPGWDLIFNLNAEYWPIIAELGVFPLWPSNNQPQWHLGTNITEVDSHNSYGVQLADFIAYVTRRNCENLADHEARRVAIINEKCSRVPFVDYKGISLLASYKIPAKATRRSKYAKLHKLPRRFIDN